MARGRFITLEGGEGTGKSTQARLLADWLGGRGIDTVVTREPGGTELAERVRKLLLDPETGPRDALTEALLFSAARRDHVLCLIRPALDGGKWVISDRFADSTRAYQGAGGALDASIVQEMESWVTAGARPDLTLVLDLEEDKGLERVVARAGAALKDRFEGAAHDFHVRLRLMYLRIAQSEPERCVVVDAAPAPEVIAETIRGIVKSRLGL